MLGKVRLIKDINVKNMLITYYNRNVVILEDIHVNVKKDFYNIHQTLPVFHASFSNQTSFNSF